MVEPYLPKALFTTDRQPSSIHQVTKVLPASWNFKNFNSFFLCYPVIQSLFLRSSTKSNQWVNSPVITYIMRNYFSRLHFMPYVLHKYFQKHLPVNGTTSGHATCKAFYSVFLKVRNSVSVVSNYCHWVRGGNEKCLITQNHISVL